VRPLRIGLVGAGWIAGDHVTILRQLGGVEIVALCDLDPEKGERLAPSGARVYVDWEELLERETIDALFRMGSRGKNLHIPESPGSSRRESG